MLLREDLRRAVDGDGVPEPDVHAVLRRLPPDVLRTVLKIRRPALHAEVHEALGQNAAYAAALGVLQKHQHPGLVPVYDRIHAPGQEIEDLLYVRHGEEDALLRPRGAGAVEGHGFFHLALRGTQQAVARPGEVGGEGKGQLRNVREAEYVRLRNARPLEEAAVEGAVFAHAADGLLQLPEPVGVEGRVVHALRTRAGVVRV